MKFDIVFAGVGGQGVLSVAAAIAAGALEEGLYVLQSEVHGMSQRGGAVSATLRISDKPVASPLVADGTAHLILSMEPLESLRYLSSLSPEGTLITATTPVKNIGNYPPLEEVLAQVKSVPRAIAIDTDKLAREAGSARASNMVLVGAASRFLPLKPETMERAIRARFSSKGEKVVETNIVAYRSGLASAVAV